MTENRTPAEQIAALDAQLGVGARLGVGVGAVKERARLAAQVNPSKKTPKQKKSAANDLGYKVKG